MFLRIHGYRTTVLARYAMQFCVSQSHIIPVAGGEPGYGTELMSCRGEGVDGEQAGNSHLEGKRGRLPS